MTENERLVRETWERVNVSDKVRIGDWLDTSIVIVGCGTMPPNQVFIPSLDWETLDSLWDRAADFTRTRIEEVRKLRREIEIVNLIACWYAKEAVHSMLIGSDAGGEARQECTARRAVERLTAELARLQQGMKGGGQ